MGLLVEKGSYERCFFLKRESVWRISGKCNIHIETLFPGYVFVITQKPQEFYEQLKNVPMLTKLLGREEAAYFSIREEEEVFLNRLLNNDREDTVRLSPVLVNEERDIIRCGGALGGYEKNIIKKRVRLRYVIIRVMLLGTVRDIKLGIQLREDTGLSGNEFLRLIDKTGYKEEEP